MTLSKLGVFANLALAASAVLLPSAITAADVGEDNVFKGLAIDPFTRTVYAECDTCALAIPEEDKMSWQENSGNTFRIDFEIGGHRDTLKTDNGYQLFPPSLNKGIPSFYVTQIGPNTKEPLRLLVTGYTFRYDGARTVSDEGTELLPMTLQIASLQGFAVSPPVLTINVLKDTSGRLMIASVGTTQTTEASPFAQDANCSDWPLLCKWKSIVAERIEKMTKMGKGCGKGRHNPMAEETMEGKPPHRFRPGHPHRPHHGPQHMRHGYLAYNHMHVFARRAFFTIFIPIVVGIFAGTVTYLIGMVLGTLIAIVIAKIRGQDYQRITFDEEDVEDDQVVETETKADNEKQEYAELPVYEAPPVYEEAAQKQVDESK